MKKNHLKLLSFFIVTMLILAPFVSTPVTSARASGTNLISNGDFASGLNPWFAYGVTTDTSGGDLQITSAGGMNNAYDAGVGQSDVAMVNGTEYRIKFTASAVPDVAIHVVMQNPDTYHNYIDQVVNLTSTPTTFTYTFTADETKPTAKFIFQVGGLTAFVGHFDNVSVMPLEDLVVNGDFASGLNPWFGYGVTTDTSGGDLQITSAGGMNNAYDAGVGQSDVAMVNGDEYQVQFTASAVPDVTIHVVMQNPDTYHNYIDQVVNLTSTPTTFTYTFTADENKPTAKLIFQVGGLTAFVGHIDNVSVKGPVDLTSSPTPTPSAPSIPTHIGELLLNGKFDSAATTPWFANGSSMLVDQGRLETTITNGSANPWDVIVGQSNVPVFVGGDYTFTVKAWASAPMTVTAIVQKDGAPYTQYYSQALALTTTPKTFTFSLTSTADDLHAALQFQMGAQGNNVVYFDNISLNGPEPVSHMQTGAELMLNGDFASGTNPWWDTSNVAMDASSGSMAATVNSSGPNVYDAIIGQNNIGLLEDGSYSVDFDAWASTPVTVVAIAQFNGPPYTQYFNAPVVLTTSSQHFHYTFTSAATNPSAQLQFQIGGNGAFVFYVDNISMLGPKATPPTAFIDSVRLNQNGYLPNAPKVATIATDVTSPLAWTLYNSGNSPVASGMTTVFGADAASGEFVHTADFSSFTSSGTGYTLEVYGETSHPFDIGTNVYSTLKYDALAYFYQTRAGIAITMPYAGRADLARPAGHIGVSPNQGDNAVPCYDQMDVALHQWTGCNYTLNVTKGWYDAGDHGKYVVNGGIAAWTLLNEYERAKYLGNNQAAFADGAMNIPENANGVPDILDEARWEIEFMLSMQVPSGGTVEGVDLTGMVHHKLHDGAWTGLGLSPDQDPQPRYLYPPSTAATLNMAAVAAQCARIWATIDPTFSATCLQAAESAWTAALAHPTEYAANNFTGGGPYDDIDVSDEFYWAASELFITTGTQAYKDYIIASPDYLAIPTGPADGAALTSSSMSWSKMQALGTISLAVVPNTLGAGAVQTAWDNIIEVADGYAAVVPGQGYLLPYKPDASGYQWGSNADVLNNMLILGLAYDSTSQAKYLDAINSGMDYILGRNPNDKSYVSGYGERPLSNPHHRFWAPSLGAFPLLPPGVVSGGPNPGLQDPYIQTIFPGGCAAAPQKCYVDSLESYSTNEITINWNAPLAWVTAFLDDVAHPASVTTATPTITATKTATSAITATITKTPTKTTTPVITPSRTPTVTKTATKTATKTPTQTATPVTVTINSNGAEDGWVLETSETSGSGGTLNSANTTLVLGDNAAKQQYVSILSFTTGSIPDNATITGLVLKVKQQAIVGVSNPFSILQGCMFDIKNGFFGTAATLQATDFQTPGTATYGPALTPSFVGNVYTFNLINGKTNINKLAANSGLTQIRLRFMLDDNNDAVANYLSLYSGNIATTADRPQLVITYTVP